MLQSRFLWKLYLAFATLIVLSSLITSVALTSELYENELHNLQINLDHDVRSLEHILRVARATDEEALQQHTDQLGKALKHRLTVIDLGGVVLGDSFKNPSLMENHAGRPEVQEAVTSGSGTSTRYSTTVGTDLIYHAERVSVNDQTLVIRSAIELGRVEERLNAMRWTIIAANAIVALIALGIGFIFARAVTTPLTQATATATAIARGNLDQRLGARGSDEVGQLGRAFNRMADELAHRIVSTTAERAKLESILTSMREGVVAIDDQERLLHCNTPAARLLDIQSVGNAVHLWECCRIPEVRDVFKETMNDSESGDVSRQLRILLHGDEYFVNMHANVLNDAHGAVAGAVAVFHDVTEILRLEGVRRDFVANVSHELKTPLTAILGIGETILEDPDMPHSVRTSFMQRILSQGRRLAALVSDLLTLSRLETPETSSSDSLCPLNALIEESASFLRDNATEKEIDLQVILPEQSYAINGDLTFLRQAIDNLIDNAIKYTPNQGVVAVTMAIEDGKALISVRDDGIGISRADQARIFERFYRVDKARSRHLGSTGLGLAIVKHIARLHGGEITVESNLGEGSTFILTLPLPDQQAGRSVDVP